MTESQRETVPRIDTGEFDTAMAFLSFARECVIKKTDGLDEEQIHRHMVPSGTSLIGLIRHLTDGERYWFGVCLRGVGDEPDWDHGMRDDRPAGDVIAEYRAAIIDSNRHIREVGDLDARAARPVDDDQLSLRWILAHMTSETARHAGHADILRELLDGVTGR